MEIRFGPEDKSPSIVDVIYENKPIIHIEKHPEFLAVSWLTKMTSNQFIDRLIDFDIEDTAQTIYYLTNVDRAQPQEINWADMRNVFPKFENNLGFVRIDGQRFSVMWYKEARHRVIGSISKYPLTEGLAELYLHTNRFQGESIHQQLIEEHVTYLRSLE